MASVYFFMDSYALFLLCFALFILFDALDGTYARTSGLASPTGGHVDRLLDGVGGVFFYLKAAMRLPPFLPLLAGSLFILNYLLMYVFHLEKRIGIFRWLAFAGIVQQYYLGLILDLFYFLVFCPTRLMYYAVRGRKSA